MLKTFNQLREAKKLTIASKSSSIRRMHRDDSGVTAVEYALIIGLVAVVLIGAITILGGNVRDTFGNVACKIQGKTWTPPSGNTAGSCA